MENFSPRQIVPEKALESLGPSMKALVRPFQLYDTVLPVLLPSC